jgi:hypothetical protein
VADRSSNPDLASQLMARLNQLARARHQATAIQ